VTGGIGIGGLAAGLITGIVVLGKKSAVRNNCQNGLCNATGRDAQDSANTYGAWSTGLFIGGAVLLTTGIVLYLTEPARPFVGARSTKFLVGVESAPGGGMVKGAFTW